ncbi:unnamed protein product [Citrullus colocynthis]|uniref:Uncharacterized protein n=1 Tax=Citrullus colocynthis TaxID=252529 RepID=A0ABP0Y6Q0_9ROSI
MCHNGVLLRYCADINKVIEKKLIRECHSQQHPKQITSRTWSPAIYFTILLINLVHHFFLIIPNFYPSIFPAQIIWFHCSWIPFLFPPLPEQQSGFRD